jgi:hypothetical protein
VTPPSSIWRGGSPGVSSNRCTFTTPDQAQVTSAGQRLSCTTSWKVIAMPISSSVAVCP